MPSPLDLVVSKAWAAGVLVRSGVITITRPDDLLRLGVTMLRWGVTPAAGYASNAIRHGDRPAIIDELGTLTFGEVHERTNRLAHALADEGIREGDNVGIMCRNHRGFIESTVALSKLGANALYLNTSFAGPQIAEVMQRESATGLIYDEEFGELVTEGGRRRKRFVAWFDGESGRPDDPLIEDLIAEGYPGDPVPPREHGRTTILTSGTTGTPKGAARSSPSGLDPIASILSKIPLHARERTMISA